MNHFKSCLFISFVLTLLSCTNASKKVLSIKPESNFDPTKVIEDFLHETKLIQNSLNSAISFGKYTDYFRNLTSLVSSLNQVKVIEQLNNKKMRDITSTLLNILDSLIKHTDWSNFNGNLYFLIQVMNDFTPILNVKFIQNPNFANEFDVSIQGIRLLAKPVKLYSEKSLSVKFGNDVQLDIPVQHLNVSLLSQQELNKNQSAITVVLFDNLIEPFIKYHESHNSYKVLSQSIYTSYGINDRPALLLDVPHRMSLLFKNVDRFQIGDYPMRRSSFSEDPSKSHYGCFYNRSMSNESFSQWDCNYFVEYYFLNNIDNRGNLFIDSFYSVIHDIHCELALYPDPTLKATKKSIMKIQQFTSDLLSNSELIQQVSQQNLSYVAENSKGVLDHIVQSSNLWLEQANSNRLNLAAQIFSLLEQVSMLRNVKLNESLENVPNSRGTISTRIRIQSHLSNRNHENFANFEFLYFDYDTWESNALCHANIPLAGLKFQASDLAAITATSTILYEKSLAWSYISYGNFQVISSIMSIVVEQTVDIKLLYPYKIHLNFTNLSPIKQNDTQECGFYDNKLHRWTTQGCNFILEKSTINHTICECDHLANSFAVLLNVDQQESPPTSSSTMVNCILALFLTQFLILLIVY